LKLLFDHNLSPALVARLEDEFPHSQHVSNAGLAVASDRQIVEFAKEHGYVVCTKDRDFAEIAEMGPQRVATILIATGNCTTATIEKLLRDHAEAIRIVLSAQTEIFIVEL
jgi:predicted nuclease of predicted toxin-antitoxin system